VIKRLFWVGLGVAVGVVAVRQLTKAAQSYSPAGMASSARNSAAGLIDSMRDFVTDVRAAMAEREDQIREAIAQGVAIDDLATDADDADDWDDTFGSEGYRRR
jgi:hypothetical protein